MKKYIKENFKPVVLPFKFESNLDNVRYAFKTAEKLLADKEQLEALRVSFNDGKYSRVQKDIPVAIKVLKYISGLGNYTKDEEHAKIVNGLKDSNIEKKAEELLTKIYNVDNKKEVVEDKNIDDYVKEYTKNSGLSGNKEELEKINKEKTAETTPAEEPEKSAEEPTEEPEEVEKKEPTKIVEPSDEEINKEIDNAPSNNKTFDPKKTKEELITSFDEKYKEILGKVSSYPEEKQKAVKREIDKQKELFKKSLADITKQETPFSGNYGETTKMRAQSKMEIAKNNAEYIIKGLELKADIKGSKSQLSLMGKQAKEDVKKAGETVKGIANKVANSYAVQKASGAVSQAVDKAKSLAKQTTDKVVSKITANTDKAKLERITATLGKETADRYTELLKKVDDKTATAAETTEIADINRKLSAPQKVEPAPAPATTTPVAPTATTGAPVAAAPAPAPAAAPVDTPKAIQKRLSQNKRIVSRSETLTNPTEKARFDTLASKQRTPEEEQEYIALNKKIEAMKLRANA